MQFAPLLEIRTRDIHNVHQAFSSSRHLTYDLLVQQILNTPLTYDLLIQQILDPPLTHDLLVWQILDIKMKIVLKQKEDSTPVNIFQIQQQPFKKTCTVHNFTNTSELQNGSEVENLFFHKSLPSLSVSAFHNGKIHLGSFSDSTKWLL